MHSTNPLSFVHSRSSHGLGIGRLPLHISSPADCRGQRYDNHTLRHYRTRILSHILSRNLRFCLDSKSLFDTHSVRTFGKTVMQYPPICAHHSFLAFLCSVWTQRPFSLSSSYPCVPYPSAFLSPLQTHNPTAHVHARSANHQSIALVTSVIRLSLGYLLIMYHYPILSQLSVPSPSSRLFSSVVHVTP